MRVPLVLVMVVGGIAHADSVRERIAALPRLDAIVTGHAFDATSHAPFAGVTVIATSNQLGQTQTAITDEHGWYSIEVPPALTRFVFYYGPVEYEATIVVPRSARAALEIEFEDPPEEHAAPACATPFAAHPQRSDVDALVASVLRREHRTKLVRWTPLLARVPRSFRLVNELVLQAMADRAGEWQIAVTFESVEVAGDCAVVKWSHDYTAPRNGEQFCLCGDDSEDLYERRNGAWRFVKTLYATSG